MTKKNRLLKLGLVMLALTLITSTFVGGTFAKYVTSGSGTDYARVAKWGVGITVNGQTFANTYKDYAVTGTDLSTATVESGDGAEVVAPGTKGNLGGVALAGIPEVDVVVTYEATKFDLSGWYINDGANYYCPIVIVINGDTSNALYGMNYASETAFENAVKAAIAGYSKTYQANTNLAEVTDDNLSISWEWAFEATDVYDKNSDLNDTALGNQAADNKVATIDFELTVTVTQID